ncbi:aminoglycoside phosphotransferase [Sphingomonas sp. ABOLD]|uniref:Fructosamine-3-kinase n=1 Tax=Sphingomonas trueperi TaxID=53317 RepID=A0A7X5XY23_9SPHN|nr:MULTISPECIES: fructosamine kinase family protein [Sphingomonas]NJB97449.1 fructosamine-3-kinase [Sphingomonas trueperi]RSV45926.1 aminoglycoside phosphotransferase [Sphingomonas sp. ABOLD]
MQTSLADRAADLLRVPVSGAAALSGGDLSAVHRLRLANGGSAIAKQGPLVSEEADMLAAIAATGAPAPAVLAVGEDLLLIAEMPNDGHLGTSWDNLLTVLQTLHAAPGRAYGWLADYAFGRVAIPNGATSDWPSFWAERRLRTHLSHVPAPLARRLDRLADRLPNLLPMHPAPSLLHGDLWGGNVLTSGGRVTALIDPACYHGDREVDAAMLTLFDAPPARFFDALALAPGWQERQPIYRLWPLLVHLRLFGSSYAGAVETALAAVE